MATQRRYGYNPDTWEPATILRGSHLLGSIPEETGGRKPNFYTITETLEGTGMDATTLWARLQVEPDREFGYREWIGVYEVLDHVDGAIAKTLANPGLTGQGGATQVFLENPEA
ncbi:MAG: hypothetical protein ACRD1R_17575 [Acidobacteriota bacterium]